MASLKLFQLSVSGVSYKLHPGSHAADPIAFFSSWLTGVYVVVILDSSSAVMAVPSSFSESTSNLVLVFLRLLELLHVPVTGQYLHYHWRSAVAC